MVFGKGVSMLWDADLLCLAGDWLSVSPASAAEALHNIHIVRAGFDARRLRCCYSLLAGRYTLTL